MNKFNKVLKDLLNENNLTQTYFAEQIGFSSRTVSNWINDRREPNFDTLLKIADYFKETTDYLLGREN